MSSASPEFTVRVAQSANDLLAAQRLRYQVFVAELGAEGTGICHDSACEKDRFDPFATHLLLEDQSRDPDDQLVGVYRLMTQDQATAAGGFYSQSEFDLENLIASNRTLMELSRSCLHPDYRGGTAMLHFWGGLADYVAAAGTEVLFGVASFIGTDIAALRGPLTYLAAKHAAPAEITTQAGGADAIAIDPTAIDQIDRLAAMRATPALIKAYLRLGGCVGQGAYVDHAFNTTDVCMILDTAKMNSRTAALYGVGAASHG